MVPDVEEGRASRIRPHPGHLPACSETGGATPLPLRCPVRAQSLSDAKPAGSVSDNLRTRGAPPTQRPWT